MINIPFVAIAARRLTYLRLLYLLLAFPLGTFYFVFLLTMVSVGVSTVVVAGIGLVLLVITGLCWRGFAWFERQLAINCLGADVPPMTLDRPRPASYLELLKAYLADPVTWKSLAYLLLEFPFGILAFTVITTLFSLCVALVFYPLVYVVANQQVLLGSSPGQMFPGITLDGTTDPGVVVSLFAVTLLGVLATFGSLHVVNALGAAWARFAELMLGVDRSQIKLVVAEAQVEVERGRAEESERSRRELVVNASHELRTPVASLRAHIDSLRSAARTPQVDPEADRYLGIMSDEVARLSELVDDVLSLARGDADELHLDLQPVDADEVTKQVCGTLGPLARRERNLSLVQSSVAGLPRVLADRDRLAQVLTNLIRNAINYTPDGGIIAVDTAPEGANVSLTVSDTGIGVAPDQVDRIFDRFYRTDESRARDSGGFGLGLAIVRDLVTAMGGTIEVDSNVGGGSRFKIVLQAAAGAPA